MVKFLYKIKNNKLLSVVICLGVLIILFNLFVAVFDIVQIVMLSKNSANYMSAFKPLNIVAGILNLVEIGLIVFYLIFRKRKLKVQN